MLIIMVIINKWFVFLYALRRNRCQTTDILGIISITFTTVLLNGYNYKPQFTEEQTEVEGIRQLAEGFTVNTWQRGVLVSRSLVPNLYMLPYTPWPHAHTCKHIMLSLKSQVRCVPIYLSTVLFIGQHHQFAIL